MKKITPKMAHDELVKAIGRYGWFPMNDYLEMRNIILFGDREHGYVRDIEKMIDGKIIEEALKMMDGNTIVSIRPCEFKKPRCRKTCYGWELSILPMADGFVCGRPYTVMNQKYLTLDECLDVVNKFNNEIWNNSRDVYVTGDSEGVAKVTEAFDWIGKKIAPNCYTFNN